MANAGANISMEPRTRGPGAADQGAARPATRPPGPGRTANACRIHGSLAGRFGQAVGGAAYLRTMRPTRSGFHQGPTKRRTVSAHGRTFLEAVRGKWSWLRGNFLYATDFHNAKIQVFDKKNSQAARTNASRLCGYRSSGFTSGRCTRGSAWMATA
jgi:hypothetical protein